jgi:uncharacterized protein YbjQ (UPF0145 family)
MSQVVPVPVLSDLSATEFVTLARLGFQPKGLVVGISVYDAGWTTGTATGVPQVPTVTQEIAAVSQAMRKARLLAVTRMRQHAHDLGAEGVVGVRLEIEHHRWRGGHQVARFLAVGTAISFDPTIAPPEFARSPSLRIAGAPFTSDLSGQDFVMLLRTGYRPVGVAMGNCVYQLSPRGLPSILSPNNELQEYTRAFMNARELAMARLVEDVKEEFPRSGPDAPVGVVGMTVEEAAHAGETNVIEFTALGTAVAPTAPEDPRRAPELPAPVVVVPLDV